MGDDLTTASHWLYAAEESFAPRSGDSPPRLRAKREQRKRAIEKSRAALLRWMAEHGSEDPTDEERRLCAALGEAWRDLGSHA